MTIDVHNAVIDVRNRLGAARATAPPAVRGLIELRAIMAQFAHRSAGLHPPSETRTTVRQYRRALHIARAILETHPFSAALRQIHAIIEGSATPSPFRTRPAATRTRRADSPLHLVGVRWEDIAREINAIESSLIKASIIEPFSAAALVHLEILRVHPFVDANGRLARVVLSIMASDALGTDLLLDFTRPMRSVFVTYNRIIRAERDVSSYARWVDLYLGFLRAETHLAQRLCSAVLALPEDLAARIDQILSDALSAVDAAEPVDELLAKTLLTESPKIRAIFSSVLG